VYPEVARALVPLPYDHLLLDAEVCVLDEHARPSFQRLQTRAGLQNAGDVEGGTVSHPAVAFVFDLLALFPQAVTGAIIAGDGCRTSR
jgi:ATP-dependent DNA ligase